MKLPYKLFAILFICISPIFLISCSKETIEFKEAYTFNDNLAVVKVDDKYGYIDNKLDIVIPPIYDTADSFFNGKAKVRKNGFYGMINNKNEVILPFEYDHIVESYNKNISLCKNGKWGFMDQNFNLIYPFELDKIDVAYDDYAIAIKDGKYGCINSKGEIIIDFKYSRISFNYLSINGKETPIFITQNAMDYGYIYPEKNLELEPIYQNLTTSYPNEILITCKNNKYGFINFSNGITVEPKYDTPLDFSTDGLAIVFENGIANYIDGSGKVLLDESTLTEASSFSDGLAIVNDGNGYFYIDSSGNAVIPGPFTSAEPFCNNLAVVMVGTNYGVINSKGEYICEPKYRSIQINPSFDNQTPLITASYVDETNYNTACYSSDGKLLFDTIYDKIELYGDATSLIGIVYDGGKYGCINENGIEIVPVEYVKLLPSFFTQGSFIAINSDFKYGLLDNSGKEILPFDYDKIENIMDDLVLIKVDNKFGFYNYKTNKTIEPIYDELLSCDYNNIIVRKDGNCIYLDKNCVPLK